MKLPMTFISSLIPQRKDLKTNRENWRLPVLETHFFGKNIKFDIPVMGRKIKYATLLFSRLAQTKYSVPKMSHYTTQNANIHNIEKYFKNGFGSFFISTQDGHICADFTEYEAYEVDAGMMRYGGKILFTKNYEISRFIYLGNEYPYDDENIRNILRATIKLDIILKWHLIFTHFQHGYAFSKEVRQKQYNPYLDIFTFNNFSLITRIPLILSVLHKIFAFTDTSFERLVNNLLTKNMPLNLIYGNENTIWNRTIMSYRKYTEEFCRNASLHDYVDQVVLSTAFHHMVGDEHLYSTNVDIFVPSKIRDNGLGAVYYNYEGLLRQLFSTNIPKIVETEIYDIVEDNAYIEFVNKISENIWPEWFNPKDFEISLGN